MWGVIPANIRRHPGISVKAKLLYCEITDCMNDRQECLKTNEELAEYLSYSVSSVKLYVKELKDLELICVETNSNERIITLPERLVVVDMGKKKKSPDNKLAIELTEKVVDIWNKEVLNGPNDRGIKVSSKLIAIVGARARENSEQDVIDAVKNRSAFVNNSPWHNEKKNIHHKKNIFIVLRSDQDLKKHLYMESEKKESNQINVLRF